MEERKGLVSMNGKPLILIGTELKVGDLMPDCTVLNKNLEPVKLSSFRGKVCIISSMPSLDTSVCDIMTRKFNQEVVSLGKDVVALAISMDLPFAQNRWCISADAKNINVFSDHRDTSFGRAFGVLIKDLRFLARAGFMTAREGIIRYMQLVYEIN